MGPAALLLAGDIYIWSTLLSVIQAAGSYIIIIIIIYIEAKKSFHPAERMALGGNSTTAAATLYGICPVIQFKAQQFFFSSSYI